MTSARTLGILFAVGCATPASSLRADNRRLNQTVTDLRTDRRAQDRKLRDLQHQLDDLHAKQGGAASEGLVPVLPVEVAGPAVPPTSDGSRVVGVADDGTEIVYEGDAVIGRTASLTAPPPDDDAPVARRARTPLPLVEVPSTGDRIPSDRGPVVSERLPTTSDRIEVTRRIPPISARAQVRTKTRAPEPPGDRAGDAAADYRAAVDLVKAGKHDEAVAALRGFIVKYPRHDYADNAQYWLGEAFYAQKDYTQALVEFRKVIEVYPRGNKVPDALLKVGYCYQSLGQGEKAHAVLEQVVTRYPRSEPATLAAKRLETP